MSEPTKETTFQEEAKDMATQYEPLNETELKLIHWSWSLGVGLLVLLFIVSKFLIPHQ